MNRELLPTSGIRAGLSAITPAAFLPIPGILLASPLPDCSISLPVESHALSASWLSLCAEETLMSWAFCMCIILVIILCRVTWVATSHITASYLTLICNQALSSSSFVLRYCGDTSPQSYPLPVWKPLHRSWISICSSSSRFPPCPDRRHWRPQWELPAFWRSSYIILMLLVLLVIERPS